MKANLPFSDVAAEFPTLRRYGAQFRAVCAWYLGEPVCFYSSKNMLGLTHDALLYHNLLDCGIGTLCFQKTFI